MAEAPSPLETRIDFEIMRALEWRSGRLEPARASEPTIRKYFSSPFGVGRTEEHLPLSTANGMI